MSKNINLAKFYFELSNNSNFNDIQKLFTKTTTYSSENTGLYLGVDEIIDMQKNFHGNFEKLDWKINNIVEVKEGIVEVDFSFYGVKKSGEAVTYSGLEYIVMLEDKIQHIEIRNK